MSSDFLEEGSDFYLPDAESQEILEPGSLYERVEALTEEHDYSYPVRRNNIDDTEVVHVGALHTMEAFENFKEFYFDCIDSADAVMMEDPFGMHFCEHNGEPHFFGSLGMIAAEQGKDVYETDPDTDYTRKADFSLAGLGGYGAVSEGVDALASGGLDNAAAALAGAYILYGTLGGYVLRDRAEQKVRNGVPIKESLITEYGLNDKLQWGETDWRNIMMAENTETICKEEDIEQLITFQGAIHTDKIAGYIDDKAIRKTKKAAYLPFQALASEERKLKKFEYTEENGWEKNVWPYSEE